MERSEPAVDGRFGKADDPRGQHDEHLLVIHLFVFLGKKVTNQWNIAQPRNPLHLIGQSSLNQTSQQIYFSFLQAEVVLNNALAESRLSDPAHGDGRSQGGNLNLGVNGNLSGGEQVGGQVQVHTNILKLKLRTGKQANTPC